VAVHIPLVVAVAVVAMGVVEKPARERKPFSWSMQK
jgi:hypothetical protein